MKIKNKFLSEQFNKYDFIIRFLYCRLPLMNRLFFKKLYSSDYLKLDKKFEGMKNDLPIGFNFKGKKCLELGPGNSEIIAKNLILNQAKEVILVDKYPRRNINKAQQKYLVKEDEYLKRKYEHKYNQKIDSKIRFIAGDINKLNIKQKFDFIYTVSVLEHIKKPEETIKNLSKLLKRGGVMSHYIDLRDHYNFSNPTLFYKYSDRTWNKYLTREGVSYTNRLRFGEWKKLFHREELQIISEDKKLVSYNKKKLNDKFYGCKDLNAGVIRIVLKKNKKHLKKSLIESVEKNKTVVHIIDHLGFGGAQVIVKNILQNSNNSYLAICRERKNKIDINKRGKVISLKRGLLSTLKLKKLIVDKDIQIVHCHLLHSKIIGLALKRLMPKLKLIYHEHGSISRPSWIEKFVQNKAKKDVDHHVAISKYIQQVLQKKYDINTSKISIINNPVDLNKFKKQRLKTGISSIGFAGRIIERKGWREFLKLAKMFYGENSKVRFVIAGNGAELNNLKLFIRNNQLNNVSHLGFVENMPKFYNDIDCLIVSSHWEPMGLVELEAQASGVPVIASDVPGLNEVVNDRIDCLLFKSKNVSDLAKKVRKVIKDAKLRRKLIKYGLQNVKKYSLKQYLRKLREVYDGIF